LIARLHSIRLVLVGTEPASANRIHRSHPMRSMDAINSP
jgi:hypothetical protein